MELKVDAQGNIETNPLLEYTTHAIKALGAGILALRYERLAEGQQTPEEAQIQLILRPAQMLALADALRRMAQSVPLPVPPGQGPSS